MYPTRLLRRVIHYLWECFQEEGERKIRLHNYTGDELHVDESVADLRVTVRYFAKQPSGELVKQMEVVCFILHYGEWIPLELSQAAAVAVLGTSNADTGRVALLDHAGQAAAAGLCDTWALQLLEEGFLAAAAKLNPLDKRPAQRPAWPVPTMPTPALETIEEWMWEDGGCEATDGCWTEMDGVCQHGHPSWLRRLGLV